MNLFDRLTNRISVKLGAQLERAGPAIGAKTLPRFAEAGPGLIIRTPREISNAHLIRFGRDVKLGPNCVIKATTRFPGGWLEHPESDHVAQTFTPELLFGDRVTATWALQVVAFERIVIEDDVMFAGNIYVSDGRHGLSRGDRPYKFQGIEGIAPVRIGRGSWIGQNVVILPGSDIGELSVVGANSVVSGKIPAHSVVVGSPARVVRTWDPRSESWRRSEDEQEAGAAQRIQRPLAPMEGTTR